MTTRPRFTRASFASRPLAGLQAIEFTSMVMAPTCGMVRAAMVAENFKPGTRVNDIMDGMFSAIGTSGGVRRVHGEGWRTRQ